MAAALFWTADASARPPTTEERTRYADCISKISTVPDEAYEDALIWRSEGGGALASHCVALSLFELGRQEQAASHLESLAGSSEGGDAAARAEFYAQAGNAWLAARYPVDARRAFTRGLALTPDDPDLLIDRARAAALMGEWRDADDDLTEAIALRSDDSFALRLRADAKLQLGELDAAASDADAAIALDPADVDARLIRGNILEAQRRRDGG